MSEEQNRQSKTTRPVHRTVPVQVWADVDEGVANFVRHLNTLPGVRTYASCQGTIGEGGPEPYPAFVMVGWENEEARRSLEAFGLVPEGEAFGRVFP